jgi:hypothetical protein
MMEMVRCYLKKCEYFGFWNPSKASTKVQIGKTIVTGFLQFLIGLGFKDEKNMAMKLPFSSLWREG